MSMIEKMSILGIRSFGSNDSNQQVIEFQHPLTLLVGPNGAGKTTIIECLRYATTGDHPINTKGGAFVHDPKIAHENEVRAKVRLKCRSIHGHSILVERGMTATQKAKTVQFKTMDGVITKIRNDEKVSITSKCAELNREMVSSLGVSKPVLENVIFCHQEEANWPLSEGKSVKQKFDDIFAATRYIKALEEIRKIQKGQDSEMKKEKVALGFLKTNKDRAEQCQSEYEEHARKFENAKQRAVKAIEDQKPIRGKYRDLELRRGEISKLSGENAGMKSRHQQMVEYEKKLRSRIKHVFTGSDSQLSQLLKKQGQDLEVENQKQKDCENRKLPLQRKLTELSDKKIQLSVNFGNMEQEIKKAEQQKRERNKMIITCKEECDIQIPGYLDGENLTDRQVNDFEQSFSEYVTAENHNFRSKKIQLYNENQRREDELKSAWQDKTGLIEGMKHKEKNLTEISQKFNKNKSDLRRLESAVDNGQLDSLQEKLNAAQQNLERSKKSNNIDELRENLNNLKKEKSSISRQVDDLDSEITNLQKSQGARTKVDLLKKDKTAKHEAIERIKKKTQESLSSAGLATPDHFPDKLKVKKWIQKKEQEFFGKQTELNSQKSQLTQYKTEQKIISKQIEEKQTKSEKLDEDLFELCCSQDIDADILKLKADINSMQDTKGLTDGIQYMYKQFLRDMQEGNYDCKSDIPCPLCQRLFEETSEIDELIDSLKTKLELAPSKLVAQRNELEKKQKRYQVLIDNRPKKTEYDNLMNVEIPKLRHRKEELETKISDFSKSVEVFEDQLSLLHKEESEVKSAFPDVNQVDNLMVEVENLEREIRRIELRIPSHSSNKSLDDITNEKRELSRRLNRINEDIENKQQGIEDQTECLHLLKNEVHSIQQEKLQLTSNLQKCEQLQEIQTSLSADIKRIKGDLLEDKGKLEPLMSEYTKLERIKKDKAKRNEEKINEMSKDLIKLQRKQQNFQEIDKTVKRFNESNIPAKMQRVEQKIHSVETEVASTKDEIEKLTQIIESIHKKLSTCAERKRDLDDNILLRESQKDIKNVEDQLQEMEKKLKGMNSNQLEEEMRKLSKLIQELQKEEQHNLSNQEFCAIELRNKKRELSKDEFKFADERYRDSFINSTTLELASSDLGKYYKALDRAVMRFHQIKMDEINKIIRDLWQETYRGKDIDFIQIESSDDTGSSTSTRRVFNYRVVMHSGDTSMDMRGRCSAGQKVLASLVIRLALAETFCINCGILALDEPTTNLDRDNIESLAKALVSIIESRAGQRNFQLVVITHDEDFVHLLGRSSYVDHFFRVNKDDLGKSKIIKCSIRTLDS